MNLRMPLTCLLLFSSFGCLGAEEEAPARPVLEVSTYRVNFGKVSPEKSPEKIITLTNTGTAGVGITAVKSTCPCTSAKADKQRLEPGESAALRIVLHLKDYRSDAVQGRVVVCTDALDSCCAPIEVEGDIIPEYVLEPPQVDFGRVKRGETVTASCLLRRNGSRPVQLRAIKASDELQVSWAPISSEADAGEGAGASQMPPDAYRIEIRYTAPLDANTLNARFEVETDVERKPRQTVVVKARLVGVECTVTPKVIVFDGARRGEPVPGIEVTGENDLEIVKAECTIPGIDPVVTELEPRKRFRISLRVTERAPLGDVTGKLRLRVKEGSVEEVREVGILGSIGF